MASGRAANCTDLNGWKWVEDCCAPSYEGAPADARAWLTEIACAGTIAAGGWYNKPEPVCSALRCAGDEHSVFASLAACYAAAF